jgi:hypothetical protein
MLWPSTAPALRRHQPLGLRPSAALGCKGDAPRGGVAASWDLDGTNGELERADDR